MERRAGICLSGMLLALTLVSFPALAQYDGASVTTVTTTTTNMTGWDKTLPVSPASDEVMALQLLSDRNFTKRDIQKVLPLLIDLENAEDRYFDATHRAAYRIAYMWDASKVEMSGSDGYWGSQQTYRDKRNSIWATIDKSIGSDKASALRNLVEPQRIDMSVANYHTAWLDRIESDLRELDRLSAARMAANGQARIRRARP